MEIELSDASGLPEALKAVVQTVDGKTKLNLDQLVPAAALDDLKGKLQGVTSESIARRKEIDAWKALGADPAEVQAKLAKGVDPSIVEQWKADGERTKTEYKAKLAKVVTDRATADLKAELARAGVIPSALDDIATVARGMFQIDDDGDVRIVGPDGKPMIGGGANGGATMADLAKTLAAARPWAVVDGGAGGAGKPAGSGGQGGSNTMKRSAFNALDPMEQAKIAQTVRIVD